MKGIKHMTRKTSNDAILERLENLKEDMVELKEIVKLLQEDYVQRKSVFKFIIWAAGAGSAVVSFFVTHILDKFR